MGGGQQWGHVHEEIMVVVTLYVMSQNGRTALGRASLNGHLEVVKALLAAGADKEAMDGVSARGHGVCW